LKLYELLLLILLIVLLLYLLTPVYITAVNKAAQKGTMKDMTRWSRAIQLYYLEHNTPPKNPAGPLSFNKETIWQLTPYLDLIRSDDWWGTPYRIWIGKGITKYGITTTKTNDFIISSFGKDKLMEFWQHDTHQKERAQYYKIRNYKDFNKDIIIYNGKFVRCPK